MNPCSLTCKNNHFNPALSKDYCPILGNLLAITRLACKILHLAHIEIGSKKFNYALSRVTYKRLLLLSIPVLGNILVGFLDHRAKSKKRSPAKILEDIQEGNRFDIFHASPEIVFNTKIMASYIEKFYGIEKASQLSAEMSKDLAADDEIKESIPNELILTLGISDFLNQLYTTVGPNQFYKVLDELGGYTHPFQLIYDVSQCKKGAFIEKKEAILRDGISLKEYAENRYLAQDMEIFEKIIDSEISEENRGLTRIALGNNMNYNIHYLDLKGESFFDKFLNSNLCSITPKKVFMLKKMIHSFPYCAEVLEKEFVRRLLKKREERKTISIEISEDEINAISIPEEKRGVVKKLARLNLDSQKDVLEFFGSPDINQKYKRFVLLFHPDKNAQEHMKLFERLFVKLNKARMIALK